MFISSPNDVARPMAFQLGYFHSYVDNISGLKAKAVAKCSKLESETTQITPVQLPLSFQIFCRTQPGKPGCTEGMRAPNK